VETSQPSAESRHRLELARRIAEACPPELGREIAATGSAAAGWADFESDVELNLFVGTLPTVDERLSWLHDIGAEDVELDLETTPDGTSWSFFRVGGVVVEAGWQQTDAAETWLRRILAAETRDHWMLVPADALVTAVPLRSEGLLAEWRARLSDYPPELRDRLIEAAVSGWREPWSRLTLARRGDGVRFREALLRDCQAVLRILFALNNHWEPDWKWIEHRAKALDAKPEGLSERLNQLVETRSSEEAVADCCVLIRDTLALVPPTPSTERAAVWATSELERVS
jgi:Domain of unknown function (DUF4037)